VGKERVAVIDLEEVAGEVMPGNGGRD